MPTEYTFNIIGTNRSIADATVLKAAYETVKSEGFENLVLEVNSIGDRDSFSRFQRELTQFFRKNINDLDPECRQAFKKDPLALLECSHESCAAFKERMPHPMNYLSEISRAHFMEFLEIIETLDIPYTINHSLVRCPSVASHTIFEITGTHATAKKSEVVVRGCRWGSISKKIGLKKDFLGVSAHVFLPKTAKADVKMKKVHKPVFYFIQIGEEARLKSLNVIEILHKAKIPVYHSLTKDKLTLQLQSAESMKVPYILIMGQKESMDSTVLVRDTNNRSQDTIALKNLAEHLKKML
jgi:histidyl-tRNA synthetase